MASSSASAASHSSSDTAFGISISFSLFMSLFMSLSSFLVDCFRSFNETNECAGDSKTSHFSFGGRLCSLCGKCSARRRKRHVRLALPRRLRFGVDFSARFFERFRFLFETDLESLFFGNFLFSTKLPYVLGDTHAAPASTKMRSAHGTSSFTKAMAR